MPTLRTWRDRVDAPEVRQARMLVKRMQAGPLDVLYLADSTAYFVSPKDSDLRQLRQMLADELQPEVSIMTVGGGGYHPKMAMGYLRSIRSFEPLPVIILPLTVRTADPNWLYHPFHGHPRATAFLETLQPSTPRWRIRAFSRETTAEQMARHDLRPHPSLAGHDLTVGDHRRKLKNADTAEIGSDAWLGLLYSYHHTHLLRPDDDGLANMAELAAMLRQAGFRVVPYTTPIPVARGTELLGPQFRERAEANMALVVKAFAEGYPEAEILHTSMTFPTEEFLDPNDGSEHLNDVGRGKLCDAIATRVRELVAESSSARG